MRSKRWGTQEVRYISWLQDLWQPNEEQRGEVCLITTRSLVAKWGAKRWAMSYYYKISGRQMRSKEVKYVLLLLQDLWQPNVEKRGEECFITTRSLAAKWGAKRWGMSYYYKISGSQMRSKEVRYARGEVHLQDLWQPNKEQRGEVCLITIKISGSQIRSKEGGTSARSLAAK